MTRACRVAYLANNSLSLVQSGGYTTHNPDLKHNN